MRILIIGGMHGNEPLGTEVVSLFKKKPVKNVDVILANDRALKANSRFVGQDLNRSFPGDNTSTEYESRRAAQLLKIAQKYDIVFDFHNTYCPNNDCVFIGQSAQKVLYQAAAWLALHRVIVADYDCINKYASNCVSIEISLSSALNNPGEWYQRIKKLSRLSVLQETGDNLEMYRFVYRMTLEDRDRYALQSKRLKAFEPISNELAVKFGIVSPAYPIFIADEFTPYNYGGLLNRYKYKTP